MSDLTRQNRLHAQLQRAKEDTTPSVDLGQSEVAALARVHIERLTAERDEARAKLVEVSCAGQDETTVTLRRDHDRALALLRGARIVFSNHLIPDALWIKHWLAEIDALLSEDQP